MQECFLKYVEDSIKKNWDLPSLTDFKGATSSYKDVARKIENSIFFLNKAASGKGTKSPCAAGICHPGALPF